MGCFKMTLSCFKSYDVRGKIGDNLDEDIAFRIGRAFAKALDARAVVLGRDIRDGSSALHSAIARGLMREGADVFDIGHCGSEEVYFATDYLDADGGLMVTGSHIQKPESGIKMVRRGARPIPRDAGFARIHDLAAADNFGPGQNPAGRMRYIYPREAYAERVLSFVDAASISPMKVLVNAGNGSAGPTFDVIAKGLLRSGAPLEFVKINHEPNCEFPNGIPNPLLPKNRPETADAVTSAGADLGIAWDGAFDRCFFFDQQGNFVDGEYVVALIAAEMLSLSPGGTVVHDPRVIWNTLEIVEQSGGKAVASRAGHALIKETVRSHDAVYGGEMSARHYFRDFMYCDSGMIPWLLVLSHMSRTGCSLSDLVAKMRQAYPSSGELNFRIADPAQAMAEIERRYSAMATNINRLDGVSITFPDWRFNLRSSKTEPVLRLNVEALGDRDILDCRTQELSELLAAA